MGNIKFKRSNNLTLGSTSGGVKLKRVLSIEWIDVLPVENSLEDIIGTIGSLERAVTFGNPQSLGPEGLSILGVDFVQNKRSYLKTTLTATLENKRISIIDGPLFKPQRGSVTYDQFLSLPAEIQKLITLGAWVPHMSNGGDITLGIDDLEVDNIYEVRIVIADGRRTQEFPQKIIINPGDATFDAIDGNKWGSICVGRFISPDKNLNLTLSCPNEPPRISSLVIRKIGYTPRSILNVRLAA